LWELCVAGSRRCQPVSLRLLNQLGLPGHSEDKRQATFSFLLFDVAADGVEIVIELGRVGVADPTNFIDNWIVHVAIRPSSALADM
jgi:hypothetical protein